MPKLLIATGNCSKSSGFTLTIEPKYREDENFVRVYSPYHMYEFWIHKDASIIGVGYIMNRDESPRLCPNSYVPANLICTDLEQKPFVIAACNTKWYCDSCGELYDGLLPPKECSSEDCAYLKEN